MIPQDSKPTYTALSENLAGSLRERIRAPGQKAPLDPVSSLTRGMVWVMLVAVLGIVANILLRDGPDVPHELDFLEGLIGAGVSGMALLSAYHTWLAHKRKMGGKE